MYVCMYVCMYSHIRIHTHIIICVYTYLHMCVRLYKFAYTHISTDIYIYIYTYTHSHIWVGLQKRSHIQKGGQGPSDATTSPALGIGPMSQHVHHPTRNRTSSEDLFIGILAKCSMEKNYGHSIVWYSTVYISSLYKHIEDLWNP